MHFRYTISGAHVAPSSSKSPKRLPLSLAVQAMKTITVLGLTSPPLRAKARRDSTFSLAVEQKELRDIFLDDLDNAREKYGKGR